MRPRGRRNNVGGTMTVNLPKHRLTRVAISAAVAAVPARVYAILLVGGSAASTLKLYDAADGNGTDTVTFAAIIGDTVFVDFESLGPVDFPTKLWAAVGGTGGIAYIWWD